MDKIAQKKTSELFEMTGTFFAFGDEQWSAKVVPDTHYTSCGAGMYCPTDTVAKMTITLNEIMKASNDREMLSRGLDGVILDSLSNHECYYTGDVEDAVDDLAARHPQITLDDIQRVYRANYDEAMERF